MTPMVQKISRTNPITDATKSELPTFDSKSKNEKTIQYEFQRVALKEKHINSIEPHILLMKKAGLLIQESRFGYSTA
jgi:hypothetical protein